MSSTCHSSHNLIILGVDVCRKHAEKKRLLTHARMFKLTSYDRRSSDSARSRQHAQLAVETADMQPDRRCVERRARAFPTRSDVHWCVKIGCTFPVSFFWNFFKVQRVRSWSASSSGFGRGPRGPRGGVGIASRCKEERRMGSACIRALDLQPALEQLNLAFASSSQPGSATSPVHGCAGVGCACWHRSVSPCRCFYRAIRTAGCRPNSCQSSSCHRSKTKFCHAIGVRGSLGSVLVVGATQRRMMLVSDMAGKMHSNETARNQQ